MYFCQVTVQYTSLLPSKVENIDRDKTLSGFSRQHTCIRHKEHTDVFSIDHCPSGTVVWDKYYYQTVRSPL